MERPHFCPLETSKRAICCKLDFAIKQVATQRLDAPTANDEAAQLEPRAKRENEARFPFIVQLCGSRIADSWNQPSRNVVPLN